MADFVAMMRLAADFRAGVLALKEASAGVKALGTSAKAASADGAVLGRSFDGVKSSANQASTALQQQIDRLTGVSTTERGAAASAGVFAAALDGQARAFDALRAAVAPAITAEQQFAQAQQVVNAAVRSGIVDQQAASAVLGQAQAKYLNAMGGMRTSTGLVVGSVGNLTAQFNDIGVMLAAGQNPLMLAIQQGTQITQAMSMAGGGAGGAVKALGAAFMGMLNPVSLVTIGVIAGGAALIQWGIAALSAGEDTRSLEEKVTDLTDATAAYKTAAEAAAVPIDVLRQKYGELADEVQRGLFAQRERMLLDAQAAADAVASDVGFNLGVSATDIQNLDTAQLRIDRLRQRMVELQQTAAGFSFGTAGSAFATQAAFEMEQAADRQQAGLDRLKLLLADVATQYHITTVQAQGLAAASANLDAAQGTRAQVQAADALYSVMIDVFGSLKAADEATDGLATKLSKVVTAGADVVVVTEEVNRRIGVGVAAADDLAAAFGRAEAGIANVGNAALRAAAKIGVAARAAWDLAGAWGAALRSTTIPNDPRMGIVPGALPANPGLVQESPVPKRRPMDLGDTDTGSASGSGARGSGGGRATDLLADLQDEGKKALDAMALAVAGVNEKVQAGLLSTAEGVDAVDQARERTANGLAELIPKIEAIGGPASVAAVGNLRAALKELVGDIGKAGSEIGDKVSQSFEGAFASFLSGTKTGKAAFADFTQSILNDLAKIAAKRFTDKFIAPIFDGIFGMLGLAKGGVVVGGAVQPFEKGGIPALGVHRNTVVDQPTLFALGGGQTGVMGEAGPEAVMPLVRGPGGLSVRATGPEGATMLPLQRLSGGSLGVKTAARSGGWRAPIMDRPPVAFASGGVIGGGDYGMAGDTASDDALPGDRGRRGGTAPRRGDLNVRVVINNAGEPVTARKTGQRMEGNTAVIDLLIDRVTGIVVKDIANGGDISGALSGRFGLQRRGQ